MMNRAIAIASLILLVATVGHADTIEDALQGQHRSAAHVARDGYRHPAETLAFFDVKPSSKVVEIWPGGGWYTEILAPYVREQGQLVAAHFPPQEKDGYFKRARDGFIKKLSSLPEVYGKVVVTSAYPPDHDKLTEPGTADTVLTFRNVHNWIKVGIDHMMFESFYEALKPGGVLGVVEHRANEGASLQYMKDSGYVTEAYVIALAEDAGFEWVASSEINANPLDSKDYEKGVWTLPPSYALKDKDRARFTEIGESDRMTLKFVKPK
jgi:predicted methyltransferase